MVELADTHGSGPCDRKVVEVQILLRAPLRKLFKLLLNIYFGYISH